MGVTGTHSVMRIMGIIDFFFFVVWYLGPISNRHSVFSPNSLTKARKMYAGKHTWKCWCIKHSQHQDKGGVRPVRRSMYHAGYPWLFTFTSASPPILPRTIPFCPMIARSLHTCGFVVKFWDCRENCNVKRNRTKPKSKHCILVRTKESELKDFPGVNMLKDVA